VNWKASLLGALLVAICGLLVGVAVGGKTTTKVHTVTAPPVTTTLAAQTTSTTASTSTTGSASTTGASTATTTTESGETEASGQQQFLDEYLASQDSEKLSQDASNVSLDSNPSQQQLQGKTYQHAVAFDIDIYGAGTASYQIPSPGFTRLSSKAIGLETTSNAEAYYDLTVYKNNDSSPSSVILYQGSFHGPSAVHSMSFNTQGATDLLFIWTKKSAESTSDVFILANPVLTG
jgi:hypothetical protein